MNENRRMTLDEGMKLAYRVSDWMKIIDPNQDDLIDAHEVPFSRLGDESDYLNLRFKNVYNAIKYVFDNWDEHDVVELSKQVEEISEKLNQKCGFVFGDGDYWHEHKNDVYSAGTIIVNTSQDIPMVKIADGYNTVLSLPFINENYGAVLKHIADTTVHITQEEREKWNNKFDVSVNGETLVFTKG